MRSMQQAGSLTSALLLLNPERYWGHVQIREYVAISSQGTVWRFLLDRRVSMGKIIFSKAGSNGTKMFQVPKFPCRLSKVDEDGDFFLKIFHTNISHVQIPKIGREDKTT